MRLGLDELLTLLVDDASAMAHAARSLDEPLREVHADMAEARAPRTVAATRRKPYESKA